MSLLSEEVRREIEELVASEVERILGERALLTVEEFSAMSGLSVKAIYHRCERSQLSHLRNGSRLLIPATELRPR